MFPELPKDRLATTDTTGKRIYLYPAAAKGKFRTRKFSVHAVMMAIFLLLPWIRVHGRQWVLLDVSKRDFFLFGSHFRAHDVPMVIFVVLAFLFAIGFISAVWGRLWCGWACPQTVFTEFLFRPVERLIEGNHRERKLLDEAPWTPKKIGKKTFKWIAFTILALAIAHSFLGFFVGTHELLGMTLSPPSENWGAFLVTMSVAGILLFDFGWFREQFCTIACPYGRFQSVLLDSHSLVVAYDTKRGEPRRGTKIPHGDCVNCFRCVQVCPTGIDIRRGLQMECIACTACIDACDDVMKKTKKPLGLIRYTTQRELSGEKAKLLRARSLAYLALFLFTVSGLALLLAKKDFLEATVLRAGASPYEIMQKTSGPMVTNHFRIDFSNQTGQPVSVLASIVEEKEIHLIMPINPVLLKENENRRVDFFVEFPPSILDKGARKFFLRLQHGAGEEQLSEVTIVGPDA